MIPTLCFHLLKHALHKKDSHYSEIEADICDYDCNEWPAEFYFALLIPHPFSEAKEMIGGNQYSPFVEHFLHVLYQCSVRQDISRVTHDVESRPQLCNYLDVSLFRQKYNDIEHQETAEKEHGTEFNAYAIIWFVSCEKSFVRPLLPIWQNQRLINEPFSDVKEVERGEAEAEESDESENHCNAILEIAEAIFVRHDYGNEWD